MPLVFINNSFVTQENATVPITDRGFRFGDGVFETITFYNGKIYQEKLHFERLQASVLAIYLKNIDVDDVFANAKLLIEKNQITDGILRISITRGDKSIGYLPHPESTPTIIIETFPPRKKPDSPLSLWVSKWEKNNPKSLPVASKTMQGLNSVLAKMDAKENQCDEALLLRDNIICECSSSNIFWFKNNVLYTPSLDCGILAGTIRDAIIRLSPYVVEQGEYNINDLISADEIFITNVNIGAFPVQTLSQNTVVWENKFFDKTMEIQALIQQDIAKLCS